jgi:hypothetical protein
LKNKNLAIAFKTADIIIPKIIPGTAKKRAYKNIVTKRSIVLYPRALSIPNSKVFCSTSDNISE